MTQTVGFVGAGRVVRIMLGGWQRANALPADIRVFDTEPAAVAALEAAFPGVRGASLAEVSGADVVFVALHPQAMPEALAAIAPGLGAQAIVCSLAPKVRLAVLNEKLGGFGRLARMNPNSPSIIGEGYNPIVFADALPADARASLLAMLAPLGQSPQVAEESLERYAVISAMGPTYFGFQYATVEAMAQSFGLDEAAAREALRAMLIGTANLLFASDVPRDVALDLVPVRPLAEHEADISAMLRAKLGGMYARLTS